MYLDQSVANGIGDLVRRAVLQGVLSHVEVQVLQTIPLSLLSPLFNQAEQAR